MKLHAGRKNEPGTKNINFTQSTEVTVWRGDQQKKREREGSSE